MPSNSSAARHARKNGAANVPPANLLASDAAVSLKPLFQALCLFLLGYIRAFDLRLKEQAEACFHSVGFRRARKKTSASFRAG